MRRIDSVFIFLFLAISFVLSVEFVSFLRQNVFYSLSGLLVILIALFWYRKEKLDIITAAFIFTAYIASRLIFREIDQPTLVLRTSSILAFFFLNVVLLIGPWSRFSDRVLRIYHYRRHLGVTTFFLAWLHSSIVFANYFNYSINDALSSIFVFYGVTAIFLVFWLALTSWDYLQVRVKELWWKSLHALLLLTYSGMAFYMYTLQKLLNHPLSSYHLYVIGIFILVWIIVAPYSIIRKIMKTHVFGWKQLHVLIYIAYFSILSHIFFGVLTTQGILIKSIYFVSAAVVFGSHIAGWINRLLEDRKIYSGIKQVNSSFKEKGVTFIGIANVDDFEEGKGKKFYVNGQPIAVFKSNNDFFAVSNVCRHQKGPIYKGKVESGMVECPWHYWTYGLNDGCTFGKEKFCLPKYETRIKDGILFVSEVPQS